MNTQSPAPRKLPNSTWAEIRTAHASGIGLREIARNMGIPAGTVLARSKREGWTQQIAAAKLMEHPKLARELARPDAIGAITPMQAIAAMLADDERETRLSLSRGIRRNAVEAESAGLDSADKLLSTTKAAGLVHRWGAGDGAQVRIDIYSGSPERAVEGRVIESGE